MRVQKQHVAAPILAPTVSTADEDKDKDDHSNSSYSPLCYFERCQCCGTFCGCELMEIVRNFDHGVIL